LNSPEQLGRSSAKLSASGTKQLKELTMNRITITLDENGDLVRICADKAVEVLIICPSPIPLFFFVGLGAESAGFVEVSAQSGLEHRGGQGG
jgi:hypothetical protein